MNHWSWLYGFVVDAVVGSIVYKEFRFQLGVLLFFEGFLYDFDPFFVDIFSSGGNLYL